MQSVISFFKLAIVSLPLLAFSLTPKLIAATGNAGHLLPPVSFLTNISPVINNNGDIAFHVIAAGDSDIVTAIFYKSFLQEDASFQTLLPEGFFATDFSLTDKAMISMGTHDGGSSRGLFLYDTQVRELSTFRAATKNVFAQSSFGYSDTQNYAYRLIEDKGEKANQRRLVIGSLNPWTTFEKELLEDSDGVISYLFTHELKENFMIFKLRYGVKSDYAENRPDKLWLFDFKKGSMQTIAADSDATGGSSKIKSISNHYSVSSLGKYAYWATNIENEFVLYISGELGSEAILKTGGFVARMDAFSPAINNNADILIRGADKDGVNSLFFYSRQSKRWSIVAAEKMKIYHNDRTYELSNSRGITFIGKPNMNDRGEIVFNALVKELATGEVVEAIISLKK